MIPIDKVREIISKHELIERELSSDKIDKKNFAKKSKEYSALNEVLNNAKQYISFEETEKELKKIIDDNNSEQERDLAKVELDELLQNKILNEKKLKLALLPKDEADEKQLLK